MKSKKIVTSQKRQPNLAPIVLAIDTSCDETSAAVTCGLEIWSNIVASQVELHRPYGGVFPTVAKQAHLENIQPVIDQALKRARVKWENIDQIMVTVGPGLAPALEVGIKTAKSLAKLYQIPLIPANHIGGHIWSSLALRPKRTSQSLDIISRKKLASQRSTKVLSTIKWPVLALVVSGGHTQFILVEKTSPLSSQYQSSNFVHQTLIKPADSPNTASKFIQKQQTEVSRQNLTTDHTITDSIPHQISAINCQQCHQPIISSQGLITRQSTQNQQDPDLKKHQSKKISDLSFERQPNLSVESSEHKNLNRLTLKYTILGQSVDDAAGEALDKIGRLLNLGYPAGPVVEELAKTGNPQSYSWPLPMTQSLNYNLSFSGLKTYARNFLEENWSDQPLKKNELADFCASLQMAVFRHICYKASKLLQSNISLTQPTNQTQPIHEVWLGGGVAANLTLRKMVRSTIKQILIRRQIQNGKKSKTRSVVDASTIVFRLPYAKKLCGDNAGMVGIGTIPTKNLKN
ncbi:MAG: hypothetical protein ABIJ03_03610 [Patescibacteria group bacterium]